MEILSYFFVMLLTDTMKLKNVHHDDTTERPQTVHGDVIKWKHFPRYWPFVWGIYRSQVNSPHKGQWRWALMFFLSVPNLTVD